MKTDTVDIHQHKQTYQSFNEDWLNSNDITIDWKIEERNKQWHDTYFTRRACKDHQAKGNCRFAFKIIEHMEFMNWISKGDVILDPMCGIGSFLIIAALKGYDAIGIELERRFYEDMIGVREAVSVDDRDDLFSGYEGEQYVPGNIESFLKSMTNVGKIQVINGDARETHGIISIMIGKGMLDWKSGLGIVCSPPYGNRLSDEKQQVGSKDSLKYSELDDPERQYSNDSNNIGTKRLAVLTSPPYSATTEVGGGIAKSRTQHYSNDNVAKSRLAILCSPPYSRSTEHSNDQIDAMPEEKKSGHKGFLYSDRRNIAVLKLGPYQEEMLKVYQAMYRTLQHGSPVALITRNFIQEGQIVALDELTIDLMEQAGFEYQFTRRAELPEISMFKYMNWEKCHKEKRLPLITWEEATFYLKRGE